MAGLERKLEGSCVKHDDGVQVLVSLDEVYTKDRESPW